MMETTIFGKTNSISRVLQIALKANSNIPYYQAYNKIDFTSSASITSLPLINKETIRKDMGKFVHPEYLANRNDVVLDYTSGSTGIPLQLVRTRSEILRAARSLWKLRSEIFPDVLESVGVQVSASDLIALESPLDNKIVLSAFDLRPDRVDHYLDMLDYFGPRWLRGHPAILALLAEGLRRSNRKIKNRMVFIECNSGWLSNECRDLLSETFECRVINHYGTRELYTISYECINGTMHLLDENVLPEISYRPDVGKHELIASSLIFEVMPFIRYKVGDFVSINDTKCQCGKKSLEIIPDCGRTSDMISGTNLIGTYVFHVIITKLLKMRIYDILQYKVIQVAKNEFKVHFVLKNNWVFQKIQYEFEKHAKEILPDAIFYYSIVESISPTLGGKVQVFEICM